ncbi:2,3-bisphosphoglycerate-independent phosphoglycerate mutase [Candidatus Roizmanbacteria bacterium]|nr:2,3-bisphosphoglycerate-independent phosphoglycerate mutase [Candidatus Roizmanbacteria bacterium]
MNGVVLLVLDGYGIAPAGPGNAIYLANPQNINSIMSSYPSTTLSASGEAVGLPAGEVGNTEVGHINLGAGRVIFQDLPRINMSIADGSFFKNTAFLSAVDHLKKTGGKLHFLGLVSHATVHSSIEHLFALLYLAKEQAVKKILIHAITDGRDSPPKSSAEIIRRLEEKLKEIGTGQIASVIGRYYALDRDRRWERVQRAYECLTKNDQPEFATALDAITYAYEHGKSDEFIDPSVISTAEPSRIAEGDAVIFFNYRIDRPRELTKAFVLNDFEKEANLRLGFDPYEVKYYKTHLLREEVVTAPFPRGAKISNLFFVTMTYYTKLEAEVAFPPILVPYPLGKVLAEHEVQQLRIAESEKERFVTFYFNGLREEQFPQEERLIIPSPKVPTYDMKPEMSVYELTSNLLRAAKEQKYGFILANIANPDMVGHTGNIQATISAIKAVDTCIGQIVAAIIPLGYTCLITGDHGNAEQKINPQTGEISTEHTANAVPFIAVSQALQGKFVHLQNGVLADVAPTILSLLNIPKPETMSGRNLLEGVPR